MPIGEVLKTLRDVTAILRVRKFLAPRPPETIDSIGLRVEQNAARVGARPALLFEGRTVTWSELNALANRYSAVFRERGVRSGDAVSLMMDNRIEFIAVIIALHKLGAVVALINTNLRGAPLVHCVSVADASLCVFGEELTDAIDDARPMLAERTNTSFAFVADQRARGAPEWSIDLATEAASRSPDNPPETGAVTLGHKALYVYTSGTTGMPKAAVMTQRRFLGSASASWKVGLRLAETDRVYLCLPLYHATGLLIGWGAVLCGGASAFVRRRFSASSFLAEVRRYETNCFVYIGEICRYLLQQPERPDDADNPLERVIGNGLRPDIWMAFKRRFGIERVTEFYGASEGNAAFMNLLNKDQTIGMTVNEIALVGYDVYRDEIVRDASGRCVPVERGEPGLLLARINDTQVFEGYTDADATERKVVRNALAEGDAWFNSGDLIREVDVGFAAGFKHYQFVDRVGDTFRWRSENVSTNEVGEIINRHKDVAFCNVYGVAVPGADGRAGMAALMLKPGVTALDLAEFSRFVADALPTYAQPVFLRVRRDIDVTGTFKMVKGDLRAEGYDPSRVRDPLYVLKPRASTYAPLDEEFYRAIANATAGY